MNTMADIKNIPSRRKDAAVSPPAKKQSPVSSSRKTRGLPQLREQSGSPDEALLPSSSKQAACIPLTLPRVNHAAASPYNPPSSSAGTRVPTPPCSPRAYLQGLNSHDLTNGILRDQTKANADTYPVAWISQVQASLEEPVRKLLELAPTILATAEKQGLEKLFPEIGADGEFDWDPFQHLTRELWPHFSQLILSIKSLPPRTLGLLAEFHEELVGLPHFSAQQPAARSKIFSDALFNLLIWNGIFSQLNKSVPAPYLRLVTGLCTYVKAAWNMQAQSQGSSSKAIAAMVPPKQIEQCQRFCVDLTAEVQRLAALKTVEFEDRQLDGRLNHLRERNLDRHFSDTWLIRSDDYAEVVKQGHYYLTDEEGATRKCKSYKDLEKYVGTGSKGKLAEVVLHVAGVRTKNYLSNTYLYDLETPLFTDMLGQRVDPMPELDTKFILDRDKTGKLTVKFSCSDHAVKSAMVVPTGSDEWGVEATPLFQASLAFDGEMYFHPNEEFEAGPVRIVGQNLHMFE